MVTERRKSKRLDLNVSLQLERLEADEIVTVKYLHVTVVDASKSGIAFKTTEELEVGSFFDTKLQIWTKEVIDTVIKIVRHTREGDMNVYGCAFVGLPDSEALKIEIYQLFNDAE